MNKLIKAIIPSVFSCFLYVGRLNAQILEKSEFDLGFSIGYHFLQPVFSDQSFSVLGPMAAINKGGYGYTGSVSLFHNFSKWHLFTALDLTRYNISEIFIINSGGQNSEISILHKPYLLIPNIGFGRYIKLGEKIQTSLDFGIGFSGFVAKNESTKGIKIYDPLSNEHNYYEYATHLSRTNPLVGNLRLELCYPLERNELSFGLTFSLSAPIHSDIIINQVVGFDLEKIVDDQTFLFFRNFIISASYKFTNSEIRNEGE